MRIKENTGNSWDIQSDSGNTYTVTLHTKLDRDGCMYFEHICTCSGYRYHGHCKHIAAVEDYCHALDDQAAERVA